MRLDGKIALVTGASRGIGRAIALRLARDGAMVCVNYVSNESAARETVDAIIAAGGKAFALQADMGSRDDVARLVKEFKAELQTRTGSEKFDILVNNAGIAFYVFPDGFDESQLERQFAVNFNGPLLLIRGLMDNISDGGRIVNISSATTLGTHPQYFLYTAAKSALNNLTMNLAEFLGKRGITVNVVAPGVTETDMVAHALTPEFRQGVTARTALGRIGQPEDVADAVAMMVSPDSHWVTGQYIAANGIPHM